MNTVVSESEKTYLLHLELHISRRDTDGHLFRTFVDNWFAHYAGKPFLNDNLKPKWFNNPDPFAENDALSRMHFVSASAYRCLESARAATIASGYTPDRLVKDHAIPLKVLRQKMWDNDLRSWYDIRDYLIEHYKLGLITKQEDEILNALKLRQCLPEKAMEPQWTARYKHAGIVGVWNEATALQTNHEL